MTKLEILAKSVQDRTSRQEQTDSKRFSDISWPGTLAHGFEAMPRRSPAVIHKQHRMQMQKQL